MKKNILLSVMLVMGYKAFSQERIFSIGYGTTFVNRDSSALNFTIDLNRVPGQSEKSGAYYFINKPFGTPQWGYYFKPTADVNIGTAVASAPNNIGVGYLLELSMIFQELIYHGILKVVLKE